MQVSTSLLVLFGSSVQLLASLEPFVVGVVIVTLVTEGLLLLFTGVGTISVVWEALFGVGFRLPGLRA